MWPRVAAGFLVLLICLAPGTPLAARNCGPASIQVTVLDDSGALVSGLGADDFKVNMWGELMHPESTGYGVQAHSTLLLLDRSASMLQNSKFDLGRQLASMLASLSPGTANFATFAGDVSPLTDARTGIATVTAPSATPDNARLLFDALTASLQTMKLQTGDMVFVITDGSNAGGKTDSREVQNLLVSSGARLFVINLQAGSVSAELDQLVTVTGGNVFRPAGIGDAMLTPAQRDQAVRSTNGWYDRMSTVYRIDFQEDRPGEKAFALKIAVDKRKVKGGQVLAPGFMAPCPVIPE